MTEEYTEDALSIFYEPEKNNTTIYKLYSTLHRTLQDAAPLEGCIERGNQPDTKLILSFKYL